MADFRKSLERLSPGTPPRVPSAVVPGAVPAPGLMSLASQMRYLRERRPVERSLFPPPAVEELLPAGEEVFTSAGRHFASRSVCDPDYHHGRVRLDRFGIEDFRTLLALSGSKVQVSARERIVFLDTETTGMQGGTGMLPFLIGLGAFGDSGYRLDLLFMRDFDEEHSALEELTGRLSRFDAIVTYNGGSFDLPLLETRFKLARMPSPLARLQHFDLLITARKLWRAGHGSCRLSALERRLLSFLRGPDIPGAQIPGAYFDFLSRRPVDTMKHVFRHNADDVLSLTALTIFSMDRVSLEPAPLDDPADVYSLARLVEGRSDWERALRLYEHAAGAGLEGEHRRRALECMAVLYRKTGRADAAGAVCQELRSLPEFSFTGYEGGAIYFEKHKKDVEAAIAVIDEGLRRLDRIPGRKRWRQLLESRRERLLQKTLI